MITTISKRKRSALFKGIFCDYPDGIILQKTSLPRRDPTRRRADPHQGVGILIMPGVLKATVIFAIFVKPDSRTSFPSHKT
jgi:hypothetical protein